MKDVQATGEVFSPQKRTCSYSKHETSSLFLYLYIIFALLYDLMVSASTLRLQRVQEAVAKEPWHCTTFLIPAT
jgi:hypothetical protein